MSELSQLIQKRLQKVLSTIESAARSVDRQGSSVQLVVVTKMFPVQVIREAVIAGARILGENYPEEGVEKINSLRGETPTIQWHMIGHCQSRKVRLLAEYFDYFHACDSLQLAQKINRILAEKGKKLPILLEFNVGEEESKFGWQASNPNSWHGFLSEIAEICSLPNLDVRGIMTMPPYCTDPEMSRPYFVRMMKLRDFLSKEIPAINFSELSMGTSVDYMVAVQEGATFVRVGEAILGPRFKR